MPFTSTRAHPLPRTVRAVAVGRGVSFLGDEVALLAMAFRAKAELGHFGVAAILIAGAVPLLVFAPFAGLLVDRVRTKPLLVGVTLVQAGLCVALAWSPSILLVPLIALLACGTVVSSPAWQALVPSLVSESQLPSAMGMLQSFAAGAGLAGPFLGGFLVATYGFHVPLLVDAASFVALAAIPLALHLDRVPAGAAAGGFSMGEAFAGVRVVLRHPVIRSLLALLTLFVLALGVINVVEIYFITTSLHAGPRGYGLLGVCFGSGMLVTASLSGRIAERFPRPERTFVVACTVLCLGIGVFGLTTQLWQAAMLLVIVGAANAIVSVNASVMITTNCTDDIRGRVFSAIQGTISAAQILALAAGGLLLLVVAPRPIIVVGAVVSAATLCATVVPVLRAGARTAETAGDEGRELSSEVLPA
ncbi:MAG TPA: MFS transporter [Acidimicrobiales bacterium]|jgi:MFS family permease|nr:MFS transporter [Acidimicrobiales bacterium]